jgi:hypothetical protein
VRQRPHNEGFILAEALVSLGLAALTGTLSLTLLVWAARTIDRAQARLDRALLLATAATRTCGVHPSGRRPADPAGGDLDGRGAAGS